MRIIVTGGTGYIASNLIKELLKYDHCVGVISRKILISPKEVDTRLKYFTTDGTASRFNFGQILEEFMPDCIVHLATAWKPTDPKSVLEECLNANIRFATEVASAAYSKKVHFINIASYWELNSSEFELHEDAYTLTKQAFSHILRVLAQTNELKYSTIYLYDNYGPNDPRGKLISSLAKSYKEGKDLQLRSKKIMLNILHINDVVRGIRLATESFQTESTWEVSSRENLSLAYVVQQIQEYTGNPLRIKWKSDEDVSLSTAHHIRQFALPPSWEQHFEFPDGFSEMILE
jgi:nucleoside-diphosphate-sugar epimerase